jgi:uncharacterized protein (TIGR04141 family)
MAKNKVKTVTLRVLLIKADMTDNGVIFKNFDELRHVKLAASVPFKGILAWRKQGVTDPSWLAFVKPHIDGSIDDLKNSSTAAVLLIEAADQPRIYT